MSVDFEEIRARQYQRLENGLHVPVKDLVLGGHYSGRILRADPAHVEEGDEFECSNLIVNQGLDAILAVMFTGISQITSWFLAPFENNYTPVPGDTAATFPQSAAESTAYTSATRVSFQAAEANQTVTNQAATASFTFNATKTIYGAFLTSVSAIGSTSGTLFSAAQFGSAKNVGNGDQLLLTYTLSAASS